MKDREIPKQYISLEEASKLGVYSQEYLSLRARQKKLQAVKIGRNWVTTKEWFYEYARSAEEFKNTVKNGNGNQKLVDPPANLPIEDLFLEKQILLRKSLPLLRLALVSTLVVLTASGIAFGKDGFYEAYQKANQKVQEFAMGFDEGIQDSFAVVSSAVEEFSEGFDAGFPSVFLASSDFVEEFSQGFDSGFPLAMRDLGIGVSQFAEGFDYGIRSPAAVERFVSDLPASISNAYEKVNLLVEQGLKKDLNSLAKGYKNLNDAVEKSIAKNANRIQDGTLELRDGFIQGVKGVAKDAKGVLNTFSFTKPSSPAKEDVVVFPEEPEEQKAPSQVTEAVQREIVRTVVAVDNKELNELRSQVQGILIWKGDIDELKRITSKLQSSPPSSYAVNAPVYIGSPGLQVAGSVSASSVGAQLGGVKDLGIGLSATIGETNNSASKLTVNAESTFNSPVKLNTSLAVGTSALSNLTVDTSGNVETKGTIKVLNSSDVAQVTLDASGNITITGTLTAQGGASVSGGTTTLSALSVTGNTVLGDAAADTIQFGASTLALPNSLNIDSNTLYIDASNNRIGIGTISPARILDVLGAGPQLRLSADSANYTDFSHASTGLFTIDTTGFGIGLVDGLSIGSTYSSTTPPSDGLIVQGNTGIGTTAPDARLEINHATGDILRMTYNDADGSAANYTDFALGTNGALTVTSTGLINLQGVGSVVVNDSGNDVDFRVEGVGSANALFVQGSDGKVGIGTASPARLLDVFGSGPQLRLSADASNYTDLSHAGTGFFTVDTTGFGVGFADGVGIGSTYSTTTPPSDGLIVQGNTGIGTASPNNRLEVLSTTTPQVRVAYDTSNYATQAVSTTGAVTFDATGSGASFTFSDAISASSTVSITGSTTMSSDLAVVGNTILDGSLTVGGIITSNGNVILGSTAANTITFTGVVSSDITPDAGSTRNLGSSSKRWATGYFDTVDATTLSGTISGGSVTAATWTVNSDNGTNNAEISGLAFETGSAAFNAVLQWNASGDAARVSGYDNNLLSNYPISIFSQVSGGNQTFTSGSLFNYGQNATHAITQTGAFVGTDIDFSSNITVPNSSSGNQTGALITLKDGGASATSIGFQTAGTLDYGIDLAGTIGTAEIRLSNGEIITNTTNGVVSLGDGTNTHHLFSMNAGEAVVFNETGVDIDFRVEGVGSANALFVQGSDGKVGIGTTSPARLLDVFGSGPQLRLSADASNYTDLSHAAAGFFTIDTTGFGIGLVDGVGIGSTYATTTPPSDGLIVQGNTGIGTTAPQSLLDVQGAAGAAGILTLATKELTVVDGDVLGRIDFNAPLESDGSDAILVGASIWAEADDTFSATVNSTELVFATGTSAVATEKMRIDRDGKVGIGTSSPTRTLTVAGDGARISVRSADYENVVIGSRSSSGVDLDRGYMEINNVGAPSIALDTAGNTYFNGGNVGIGTTSPARLLDVFGSGPQLRLSADASNYTDLSHAAAGFFTIDTTGFGIGLVDGVGIGSTYATTTPPSDGLIVQGNTGIGTTSPTSFLHVDGAATATTSSTFSRAFVDNTNAITTNTGNTSVYGLMIDEPNITVGTATPTNGASLYISGSPTEATNHYALWAVGSDDPTAIFTGSTGLSGNYFEIRSGGKTVNMKNAVRTWSMIWDNSPDYLRFTDGTNDNLVLAGGGKVGIGTASPARLLDVFGSGPQIRLSVDASNYTDLSHAAAGFFTIDTTGFGVGFADGVGIGSTYSTTTPPSDGLIVQGNVGVGTTAPDAALEINHATGDSLRLTYNDSNGSATDYTDFSLSSTGALILTGSAATLGASATAEKTFFTLTPGIITLTAPTQITSLMETAVLTGATIAADSALTVDKATTLSLVAPIDSANVTLTDSSALRILNETSGTGTLTNQHGLYIEALTAATNNYGIYINTPTGTIARSIYIAGGILQTADATDSTSGSTGSIYTAGGLGVTKDLAVDGGDIVTAAATFNLINATATTLNIGGAATTIAVGAAASATTWTGQSFSLTGANTTNNTTLTVTNSTNTAVAAHSIVDIAVGGTTSTGDPQVRWTIPSGTSWYAGVDNSSNDQFHIGTGTAVGTTPVFRLDGRTSGAAAVSRIYVPALNMTLNDDNNAAFNALYIAGATATLAGITQVVATDFAMSVISRLTVAQSGGAVTVDNLSGLRIYIPTVNTSVTGTDVAGISLSDAGTVNGTMTRQHGILIPTLTAGSTDYAITIGNTDADQNLIHVGVTGDPIFSWDESEDQFDLNKGIEIDGDLDFIGAQTISTTTGDLTINASGQTIFLDDDVVNLGTSQDIAMVLDSAGVAANTVLTDVLIGTPATAISPASSLLTSNITASGDMAWYLNDGAGNSWEYLRFDGSADLIVFNEADSDINFRIESVNVPNLFFLDAGNNNIGIGNPAGAGEILRINPPSGTGGGLFTTHPGLTGRINFTAGGESDGITAASGTATNYVYFNVVAPALAAANANVTTTNAASLHIEGAPSASTNMTITNAYALWVDAGTSKFDGQVLLVDGAALGDNLPRNYAKNPSFEAASTLTDWTLNFSGLGGAGSAGTQTHDVVSDYAKYGQQSYRAKTVGLTDSALIGRGQEIAAPQASEVWQFRVRYRVVSITVTGGSARVNFLVAHDASFATFTQTTDTVSAASTDWQTITLDVTMAAGTNGARVYMGTSGSGVTTLDIDVRFDGVEAVKASSLPTAFVDDFLSSGVMAFKSSATIIGGLSTTSDLTLQTTSGVGATGADMHFLVGNNGATEAMTILNAGNVGIGTTAPDAALEINHATGDSLRLTYNDSNGSASNYTDFSVDANGTITVLSSARSISSGSEGAIIFDSGDLTITGASTSWLQNQFLKADVTAATALTIDNAATVYIDNAPDDIGAGPATITNKYALWVAAGTTRLDGSVEIGAPTTANTTALCWDNSGNSLIYDCDGAATDLAENFGTSDSSVEAGDIVSIDLSRQAETTEKPDAMGNITKTSKAWIVKSSGANDSNIIGVISTHPNQVYGEDGVFAESENPKPVSLAGRVPVKVSAENGAIAIGDPITSSSVAGVGMKATQAGRIVGYALQPYDGTQQDNKILVLMNLGWQGNDLSVQQTSDGQILNTDPEQLRIGLASLGLAVNSSGILEVDTLIARKVKLQRLELVDQRNGEIYCTWLEYGEWMKVIGECNTIEIDGSSGNASGSSEPAALAQEPAPSDSGTVVFDASSGTEDTGSSTTLNDAISSEPVADTVSPSADGTAITDTTTTSITDTTSPSGDGVLP